MKNTPTSEARFQKIQTQFRGFDLAQYQLDKIKKLL